MTTVTHVDPAVVSARSGENVVVGDEIIRHRRASRIIHWSVALTFFISLISGMPIWTPLFAWMAALVGGLQVARLIHPYAGSAFFIVSVVQFFHWLGDMRLRDDERGAWKPSKLMAYMRWDDEPNEQGGKYNPGQKVFFFAVCLGALGLLVSGVAMWFPLYFPRLVRELAILLHDIPLICFLIGLITH